MSITKMVDLDVYRPLIERFLHFFQTEGVPRIPPGFEREVLFKIFNKDFEERDLAWSITGMRGCVELFVFILNCTRSLPEKCRAAYTEISALYMVKFLFEGLTDNFAINQLDIEALGGQSLEPSSVLGSYALFNEAFYRKLEGDPTPITTLLHPLRDISVSLTDIAHINPEHVQKVLINAFNVKDPATVDLKKANISLFPWCVANIEMCLFINDLMKAHPLQRFIVEMCKKRYEGVNRLLLGNIGSRNELLDIRGAEILASEDIIARLLYIEKGTGHDFGFSKCITEIEEAACCVHQITRLLNDFGQLVLIDINEARNYFNELLEFHAHRPDLTSLQTLFHEWPDAMTKMPRLTKDIMLSEMNMGFIWKTNILSQDAVPQTLSDYVSLIASEVEYWNQRYQDIEAKFLQLLEYIDNRTVDHIAFDFLRSYADFNIALYLTNYKESDYMI
ncbi:hypothetical protein [Zooshikella sp. RANM57]|uniref:hypothetical protein n=1 Tax=Zooshikella sp. RANM57 TaxID=3425863 RepID=UPI003D6EE013